MSANTIQIAEMFSRLRIEGSDAVVYEGVRPSSVPKPFRSVVVCLPGNGIIGPLPPESGCPVLGYEAAVNCTIDGNGTELYRWKLTTLLAGGKQWITYISLNGHSTGAWI